MPQPLAGSHVKSFPSCGPAKSFMDKAILIVCVSLIWLAVTIESSNQLGDCSNRRTRSFIRWTWRIVTMLSAILINKVLRS